MNSIKNASENLARSWNGSIAIKITAVTIWTIVILSFSFTVPFMSTFEESSKKAYTWQQYQLVEMLKGSSEEAGLNKQQTKRIESLVNSSDILFVKIISKFDNLEFGTKSADSYTLQSSVLINSDKYDIYLEFTSLKRAALLERVKVGSSIVVFSVLFSLFLFWLNNKIIHKPFESIIEFTQKVSKGSTDIRLDADRGDEFGLVSRFLNEMLDTINENQQALKIANEELKEEIYHRDEALAASQQKSSFLANMSHEIRTPLTSIIGYSERIRFDKAKNRDEEKHMLDIVLQNGNHLLHLINDILDLSKVEANMLEIEKSNFSIIKVVEHARRLLNERAVEKNIQLDINYILPIPEYINNDAIRTKQVILNLASNAIQFTEYGKVIIDISYEKPNDMLVIAIKDSGIGMSEDELEKLFKPFSQADVSISRRFGGTGLGLTISKRLVEIMHGEITVQSVKGIGSCFTCKIKAGFIESENALITELNKSDLVVAEYEQPVEGISLTGRVLLVEDTYEIRALVKAYIEDYGIHIDTAENGKEGLELALNNNYDLVLMDIQMPVMNGKQAIVELRKQNYIKPVIALTADALTEHATEFSDIGFTETLTKPIIINDLIICIQKYVSNVSPAAQDDDVTLTTALYERDVQGLVELEVEATSDVCNEIAELHEDDQLYSLKIKYLKQLPDYVNNLKQSIENNELHKAYDVLHQLKGISGSLGYQKLTDIAVVASECLNNGQFDEVNNQIVLMETFYLS
ncbi:MAG: ATP-binding protein [Gammaproteobacteria bacterium]|nr:ATP-binding protein [Gammaproteobacteria bacterium]